MTSSPLRTRWGRTRFGRALARADAPVEDRPVWPLVTTADATTLRDSWYRRTVQASWSSAGDWWDPACDAVVEAVAEDRDARPAVRRLGRARAQLGVSVEEAMEDVVVLWDVHAHREPPARVLQALAAGWAESGLEAAGASSCIDTLSGLATRAHLEARLAELYRAGRLGGSSAGCQLVVLDVAVTPGYRPADEVPWRQVEVVHRAAEVLRRVFVDGETLARLARTRVCALADSGPTLGGRLAALDALLAAGASEDLAPSVWVESLPRTFGLVPELLVDLSR